MPLWLIPCAKAEEINQHSCASDTPKVYCCGYFVGIKSLKHLPLPRASEHNSLRKSPEEFMMKTDLLKENYTFCCMLKFCINLSACPKENPLL